MSISSSPLRRERSLAADVQRDVMTAANAKKSFARQSSFPLIESLENRTLFSAAPSAVASPTVAESHVQAALQQSIKESQATAMPLSSVRTFSYVLADLPGSSLITQMGQSNYDMLIVGPPVTNRGEANFNMAPMVAQLHADHPGRVVLAYLDIGEAGTSNSYWQSSWKTPTATHRGNPSFLVEPDPYGWNGTYPVAYWSRAWQRLFLGPNGIVKRIMRAGFDGVFLDWVGAYETPAVAALAHHDGVEPAQAMVTFISRIRAAARSVDRRADVIGLNASELAKADPKYLTVIDGLAAEDVWFSGTPNSPWGDPAGGDIPADPQSTVDSIANFQAFQDAGKPVFTIDYALDSDDADYAYTQSSDLGFVPLVTQISLAQLTTTPPPSLG
jgi:cysteinyl-tRNA synthetase